jgi:hypothetical protein
MWYTNDKRILKNNLIKEMTTMPRGDGTGPMGMGPMSGRAAGYCAGYGVPGAYNPMYRGTGFGRARGFRRMHYATGVPGWGGYAPGIKERDFLNQQVESLEDQLQQLKKRLSEIEKEED